MREHRKANRRSLGDETLIVVEVKGREMMAKALDVSPEGMRISLLELLEIGTEIFCKIDIYQNMSSFYAKGTIVRIVKDKGQWEAGVKFDIVRVYDFFHEKNSETGPSVKS
jgi:hypothetical protein